MKRILMLMSLLGAVIYATAQNDYLVTSKWNQLTPYNAMCPSINGTLAKTGCGATALAQILYHYRQPAHGYGSITYKFPVKDKDSITVNADFSSMYFDWDNMCDTYSTKISASDVRSKAVAQLMYACGAAVQMQYGTGGSSVNNKYAMVYGMQHYLHFSPDSRYLQRKYYSTEEWTEMLNQNLKDGHPVFYRGEWVFRDKKSHCYDVGHMFVIDGVNADNKYHVNFGHSGSGDKYLDLNVINQSGYYPGNRAVCYNLGEAMVINCYPTPDRTDYPEQSCISAGPIILNKDKNLRAATFSTGDTITLSSQLANCCDTRVQINFGWALTQNGKFIKMLCGETSHYHLSPGYSFSSPVHQKLTVPANTPNGDYQLVLYSRLTTSSDWTEVWKNAPTTVDITVKNNKFTVNMPDCHNLNPMLYLSSAIKEVDTWLPDSVPGRTFSIPIISETTNNFEDSLKLVITADEKEYEYSSRIAVYSQTEPEYRIEIPTDTINLKGKTITSIKAYYRYDGEYYEMTTERPSSIASHENTVASVISIYTISGTKVKTLKASEAGELPSALKVLPKGIYIVSQNGVGRKVSN